MKKDTRVETGLTVGVDLGDRWSRYCVLDEHGKVLEEDTIAVLTKKIQCLESRIERLASKRYPETGLLRQVSGVGPLTSLSFVLTLEDPERFKNSRAVGPYLGLRPRQSQSGEQDPELRITKGGESRYI